MSNGYFSKGNVGVIFDLRDRLKELSGEIETLKWEHQKRLEQYEQALRAGGPFRIRPYVASDYMEKEQ